MPRGKWPVLPEQSTGKGEGEMAVGSTGREDLLQGSDLKPRQEKG